MLRLKAVRWTWWLPALLVAAILAVDLMGVVRPSAISATACTAVLFRQRPDVPRVLTMQREAIIHHARLRNLPATLLAAILVDHQRPQTRRMDLSDCLGSAFGANLSLGLMQMRISTAAQLDGKSITDMSARQYRDLRRRLLAPESNISYAARELRSLLERSTRSPGISASQLLDDPPAMAVLVSEFRAGRMPAPRAKAKLAIRAFSTLELMQNGTLKGFTFETDDAARIETGIREYLRHINCESGIFNNSACKSWLKLYPVGSSDSTP